ncbi:MAG: phosphatidylserine decarboxylase [Puniceicoccales bacterium]|jgi:phosphatidylserine decarboxylase|nr:phosphatidylserine decarboxylase [Puniceicoccales bacterium]
MKSEPVVFFNRHTGGVETEKIYGEKPMRWVYETAAGRLALLPLVRRAFFSRWFGRRMRRPESRAKIAPFIRDFALDPAEFADAPDSFASFDEFFSRRLKPSARPLAPDDTTATLPADGRHLGFQDVAQTAAVYAKGQRFDLPALLGDVALAERYQHGTLVCSRLCPTDYHRFHFPIAGTPAAPRLVNGWLYSVNPIALRRNLALLWENKRQIVALDAGVFGTVLLIVIGATNVGSTTFTYRAGAAVAKGAEAGFFSFGGSFVATLFEPEKIRLAPDLLRETANGRELYAKMGTPLGEKP